VAGWEKVLNRKGTSWRKLTPVEQVSVKSADTAKPFLLANPSLIKRPVIEWHHNKVVEITVGFQPELWLAR
jgi:arsenate reductase-like glutaredoxin family protein